MSLKLEKLWIANVITTTGLVDTNTTPMLLKNVVAGRLESKKLITHTFALDEITKAYDNLRGRREEEGAEVILRARV